MKLKNVITAAFYKFCQRTRLFLHVYSKKKLPRNERVTFAEVLGTMSKNNLRGIKDHYGGFDLRKSFINILLANVSLKKLVGVPETEKYPNVPFQKFSFHLIFSCLPR